MGGPRKLSPHDPSNARVDRQDRPREIVQTTDAVLSVVEEQGLRKRSTTLMEVEVVAVVLHDVRIQAPRLHGAIAEAWLNVGAPILGGWKVTDGWASSPRNLR